MSKFVPVPGCAYSSLLLAEITRLNAEEQEIDGAQRIWVRNAEDGLFFYNSSGKRSVKVDVWGAVSVTISFDCYVDGQSSVKTTTSDVESIAQKIIEFFKD